jgi:hypothetical protein
MKMENRQVTASPDPARPELPEAAAHPHRVLPLFPGTAISRSTVTALPAGSHYQDATAPLSQVTADGAA